MRRLLALTLLGGSLAFGAAAYAATPLRAALCWAVGGGVIVPLAVAVSRRIVCGNGTLLELYDDGGTRGRIAFTGKNGKRYGPYDRT